MMGRHDRGKPLEIKDYVGALAGRGRIVAAVAIVVGFIAVVVYILQPQRYKATATVEIPFPPTTTTSAVAAVSQAYADFTGALASDQVAQQVAETVGVAKSAVKGHLSASRLSGSSVAEVTYTGTDKDQAAAIAKAGSIEALSVVATAHEAPLVQQQKLAQAAYDDAVAQSQQFLTDTGIVNPDRYFARQQAQIINIRNQLGEAQRVGNDQAAAGLQTRLNQLVATSAQESATNDRIKSLLSSTLEALQSAQGEALAAQGLVDSINAGAQVSVTDPTSAPRLSGLIKAVVPAVVVATGLAIAMIVLFEVVGPVRLPVRGRDGDEGGPETSAEGTDEAKDGEGADGGDGSEPDGSEPEEPERDPAGRPVRTRA
jgi:uncharacterized protein involved in exopolysaccharide biosynthesis